MFVIRVNTDLLENRIDSSFYNPIGLDATSQLYQNLSVKPLKEVVDQSRSITNGVRGPEWDDSEFKLIRLQDCADWMVNVECAASITEDQFHENKRCRLKANDIVVAIGGYVGNASVVLDDCLAVIGQHSAVLPLNGDGFINSRFLLSYLNCRYAEAIFLRYVSGTVQAGINLEDLRELQTPTANPQAQTYIGDKVRQAERLRARARDLEKLFRELIRLNYPGAFDAPESGKHYRASINELNRHLNPGAFNPERVRLQKYIKLQGGRLIGDIVEIKSPTINNYTPETFFFGLDAFDSSSSHLSPTTVLQAEVMGACRLMQEGPTISKLRPYLNKVGYIPSEFVGAVGSTELLNIKPNSGIPGWYIFGVLKLESTIRQLNPVSTGSTHPRVSKDDINEVYVPWVDEIESAGHLLECSQVAYFSSERLTTAAKLLVEALIEGQVTESDLINTQKALEAGDCTADREILSRLTRKGIDAAGEPPLFPDLDALYSAIDALDSPN